MAKTKFFRVAVEGATVDGRTIDRAMIQQMADTYNPATYVARINCEHLRGYSPQPPFNAYGSIAEVKTDEIELDIGGKKEKRLALLASFDVNDQAKEINKAGQKLFSSVEIQPDFAGSKKAYLVGLALTDSPASLGTEALKFSRDEKRKNNILLTADETIEIEFEDEGAMEAAADQVTGAFASMKKFFDSFTGKTELQQQTAPVVVAAPAGGSGGSETDLTAFGKQMAEGMQALAVAFKSTADANAAAFAGLRKEFDTLKAEVEKTPSHKHSARPQGTGGGDRVRADC